MNDIQNHLCQGNRSLHSHSRRLGRTGPCSLVIVAMAWRLLQGGAAIAGDWPGWRGPTGTGVSDEKGLPLKWDGKSGENVLWKAPLTGTTGHSSPVVWGDRVFVTTAARQTPDEEKRKEIPEHHLLCFHVSDGKLLWRTPIAPGKEVAGYAIYASPTPVTDGKAVYVWFGSAVIAAVDFNGKLLWRHERPGEFKLNPGITSSPILYRDTLILISDPDRDNGFLQGLDLKTGEVKWKIDKVPGDYSSPVISGDFIYRVKTDGIVQCFRLSTGGILFTERLESVSKLASPVATADGRIYFASAGTSHLIEAGPGLKVLATNRLGDESNGASPAIANGRIFVRNFEFLYCIGEKKAGEATSQK